jgi:threonine/homoserine/homoserine lactone efflux protein
MRYVLPIMGFVFPLLYVPNLIHGAGRTQISGLLWVSFFILISLISIFTKNQKIYRVINSILGVILIGLICFTIYFVQRGGLFPGGL